MRLSFLPYSHTAIVTWHKQHIAVFADLALMLCWQAYFCGHSYFSGSCYVAARQLRITFVDAFSLLEENLYSLFSYLLCSRFHFYAPVASCTIRVATNLELGFSVHNAFVCECNFLM